MKKTFAFLVILTVGCSDQFEIRKHIVGVWQVESIRILPQSANSPIPEDSVLVWPGSFIEFSACQRKENNHSSCSARAYLLGFDLELDYNIRGDRVSFNVGGDNPPLGPPRKMALLDLLRLGHEHFLATGYKTDRMTLEKSVSMRFPNQLLVPAQIVMTLTRE